MSSIVPSTGWKSEGHPDGSKVLTKEKRRYCVIPRELLAVVCFVKQYRHYFFGRMFLESIDHRVPRYLLNFKDPQGQIARWLKVLDMILTLSIVQEGNTTLS